MRVDFMIIGAQKCGTTSLAAQLAEHEQICFSRKKEPGFFNETPNWQAHLAEYHSLFEPLPGQLCGEASTMYTFLPEWQGTADRLYEYNPNLKLIYIMRHPVQRIISHYTHNLVRGQIKTPPEETVFANPKYINRSRYGVQIRPFLQRFGADNIMLLVFEEYVKEQVATLEKVAAFLGIDSQLFAAADTSAKHQSTGQAFLKYTAVRQFAETDFFQSVRTKIPEAIRYPIKRRLSNQIEQKPIFPDTLKNLLWQFVIDDVSAIEQLLGRPITVWRDGWVQ